MNSERESGLVAPLILDDWDEEYDEPEEHACEYCRGTGSDPYNDYILPCEYCDGEGYKWWL